MSPRTPLIAGNWKMYKTGAEAAETARQLVALITASPAPGDEILIAPAFPALFQVAEALKGSPIALGAQNLHEAAEGAFTGEVSAPMLAAAGCRYVIIGHSERRQFFGETDEGVRRKVRAALDHGLTPVVCVGETETERDAGKTFSVLDKQVSTGLESFVSEELRKLVIAYEPVWAIGTGKTATSAQAQEAHRHIRSLLTRMGGDAAAAVRILYGGSVKPANIAELMGMPDIDGALVGGASLKAESFNDIIHYRKP